MKWVIVIVCILASITVYALYVTFVNDMKNNQLKESMESLKSALERNGFEKVEKSSGCGKTQVKYGEGATVCTISVSSRMENIHYKEAGHKYDLFIKVVEENGFSLIGNKHIYDAANGIDFGTNYFKEVLIGKSCGNHFYYESSDLEQGTRRSEIGTFRIDLSCSI